MGATSNLDLRDLQQSDLVALAAYKLWTEVGVSLDMCQAMLRRSKATWLICFLNRDGGYVATQMIDSAMLDTARAYVETSSRIAAVA